MYRPLYHFSPPAGWMNDPNGLVYSNGLWHLFYQHEPHQLKHGPMHWGHAVSRDLASWENWPIALAPDELGTIWSGSAAVYSDEELVACFTQADTPRGQLQSLAFSRDEGRTWRAHGGNPVLTSERPDFRDPKIFRFGAGWVMVVAAQCDAELYASPDLLTWTPLSTFAAPQSDWIWECPDLLQVDGQWVLIVSFIVPNTPSGSPSCTRYYVGDFDGTRFTPRTGPLPLSFGPDDYAAVSWSDAPDARRIVIGWMSHWGYADKIPTASENWRGAMTLPRELSFRDGTLRQNPPVELEGARGKPITFDESGIAWRGEAFELEAEIDLLALQDEEVGLALRVGGGKREESGGKRDESETTRVVYNVAAGELRIDRTRSGQHDFAEGFDACYSAPLELRGGVLKLRIFVDRCSVEVFAQDGELYGAALIFPSPESQGIELIGHGAKVIRGTLYPMGASDG